MDFGTGASGLSLGVLLFCVAAVPGTAASFSHVVFSFQASV